jgi:AbrB family looped-hinge helix DNA binding protein
MQIEERTVSKVGGSSLMVTLPKGWIRYMGIKPGDKVEVITNGEVIIRPKRKSQRQSKSTYPA